MIDFLCYTTAAMIATPLVATFLTYYRHEDF
jgi:hypothetical protein